MVTSSLPIPSIRSAGRLGRRFLQRGTTAAASRGSAAASPSRRPTTPPFRCRAASGGSLAARTSTAAAAGTTIDDARAKAVGGNNSNPTEVDKFSSFASNWWDSRSNPLVGMNPVRIRFMRDVISRHQPPMRDESQDSPGRGPLPLENKRMLDIGCGGGLLTESLSRLGASLVVGVDASSRVAEVAEFHSFHVNSRLTEGKIRYVGGRTVEELADRSTNDNEELFDIVTALEVIEHVPDPASLLHAASSLLKPNGILLVSTINRTIKSYGLAIVAAEYISGKVPVGTHDWNQFRSPAEVERMVCSTSGYDGNAAMKQIGLSGMVIDPPFVNLRWSLDPGDVDVNWIGAYQKRAS